MANRNTLHHNRLEAFNVWLALTGVPTRPGHGEFEVLQVAYPDGRWHRIYRRLRGEHLTVENPLMPLVTDFIFVNRGDRPQEQAQAESQAQFMMLDGNAKPPWEQ